ncbi:MAG: aminoglycoside phosphotransferase family protein [Planctomycetota bacterium]
MRRVTQIEQLEWLALGGGVSGAAVWRCDADEKPVLAVRRWPDAIEARVISNRRAWLARLATHTELVRAPVPLETNDPRWEASPWVVGEPAGVGPASVEPSRETLRAVASGLAEWHAAAREIDGATRDCCDPFGEFVAAGARAFHEANAVAGDAVFDPVRELDRRLPPAVAAARKLARRHRGAALDRQTVHGDARPEHFLLSGGRLTGVIDHGAIRRDTPLADVARLAAELDPDGGRLREAWLDAWEAATGDALDRPRMDALEAIGAVRTAANWRRWLAAGGPPGAKPGAVRARLAIVGRRLDRLCR